MDFVNYLPLDFGDYTPRQLATKLKASNISLFWQKWLDENDVYWKSMELHWQFTYSAQGLGLKCLKNNTPKNAIKIGNREPNEVLNTIVQKFLVKTSKQDILLLDATAGLLNDSQSLLHLGFPLISYERHPLISLFILTDTQLKTQSPNLKKLWQFKPITFCTSEFDIFDSQKVVLLYDPMFHIDKHKSLPSLEMQMLSLLEEDGKDLSITSDEWLQWRKKADLIIVKRPNKAPFLQDEQPVYSVKSKLLRWDIYQKER